MLKETDKELRKSTLFRGINDEELSYLLNCLNPKIIEYKKNDYIAIAGDRFDSIGILLKGEASIIKENASGSLTIVDILKPGDLFGEVLVFSDQSFWHSTIQALKDCRVMFLTREKILGECKNVCSWHKMLIQNMLRIISEKALILNRKVEYLTMGSIRGKVSRYLLEQFRKTGKTTFTLPMNRKELADFLNVSRPSLSREMARMRDEGIIDFHMSTVKIVDLEKLKKQL